MTTKTSVDERSRFDYLDGVEAAPDIIDDDMPDSMFQIPFFIKIIGVLIEFFRERRDALVHGDGPVYYRGDDGVQRYFKPDGLVAFGVDPDYIYARNGYFIEEVGKQPDFVLEIASVTTADNDTGGKRDLYEKLRIPEYFGFDATGGDYYGVPLFGWRLRDGEYVPVQTIRDANGAVWAYSEILGLYLCAEPQPREARLRPDMRFDLRAWNPETGDFLRTLPQEREAHRQTEAALQDSERARDRAESELRVERLTLQTTREAAQTARESLQSERAGRRADAARIRELERQLRELRGE